MKRDYSRIRSGTSKDDPVIRRFLQRQWKRDERLIKKQLGVGMNDPLPRCPHRSDTKLNAFSAGGDYSHNVDGHLCTECGCEHIAGTGTDHYGWGLCHIHEAFVIRHRGANVAERINETHRAAIIERHPGIYRDRGKFAAMVRREGAEAEERISLIEELQIARGTVQELISLAKTKPSELPQAFMDSDVIQGEDADGNPVALDDYLWEYVNGTRRPMSPKTRLTLIGKCTANVAKIAKLQVDLTSSNMLSEDQMKIWFAKVWSLIVDMGRKVQANELNTGEEVEEFMRNGFKQIGSPFGRTK